MKAKWTFTAVVPTDWEALSNQPPVEDGIAERNEEAMHHVKEAAALFGVDFSSLGDLKVVPFV